MQGYQLMFFTQQERSHHGKPIVKWLVDVAREMALPGVTVLPASEGFGHHRVLHSVHFFELADQPVVVVMALSETDSERLMARLQAEKLSIFYTKMPIEYGFVGA